MISQFFRNQQVSGNRQLQPLLDWANDPALPAKTRQALVGLALTLEYFEARGEVPRALTQHLFRFSRNRTLAEFGSAQKQLLAKRFQALSPLEPGKNLAPLQLIRKHFRRLSFGNAFQKENPVTVQHLRWCMVYLFAGPNESFLKFLGYTPPPDNPHELNHDEDRLSGSYYAIRLACLLMVTGIAFAAWGEYNRRANIQAYKEAVAMFSEGTKNIARARMLRLGAGNGTDLARARAWIAEDVYRSLVIPKLDPESITRQALNPISALRRRLHELHPQVHSILEDHLDDLIQEESPRGSQLHLLLAKSRAIDPRHWDQLDFLEEGLFLKACFHESRGDATMVEIAREGMAYYQSLAKLRQFRDVSSILRWAQCARIAGEREKIEDILSSVNGVAPDDSRLANFYTCLLFHDIETESERFGEIRDLPQALAKVRRIFQSQHFSKHTLIVGLGLPHLFSSVPEEDLLATNEGHFINGLLLASKHKPEAIGQLALAYKHFGRSPLVAVATSSVLCLSRSVLDQARAIKILEVTLNALPEKALSARGIILELRGQCRMNLGHWSLAIQDFERALPTLSNSYQRKLHKKLASAYLALKDYQNSAVHQLKSEAV